MRNFNFSRGHSQGRGEIAELSNQDIMRIAPSVFAEEKHESRSDRYSYVPSSEILVALRKEGFVPYYATQSKSRIAGKSEFTKHMLRFRHLSQMMAAQVGNEVNEVVMVNSHDGTSKINLFGGRYRFTCSNGLMYGESIEEVSFPHTKVTLDNVIEGAYTIVKEFDYVDDMVADMQNTPITMLEQQGMALQALSLKFDMSKDFRPSSRDILMPRRQEDVGSNLWTTFNVIQENIIRGGVPKTVNPPENGRHGSTRETKNITDSVTLNRGMWDIATAMRMAKSGLI